MIERGAGLQRLPSVVADREVHDDCPEAALHFGCVRCAKRQLCGVLRSQNCRNMPWKGCPTAGVQPVMEGSPIPALHPAEGS
jgi:hypothetical protein